jgi:hypothetical protein
VTYALKVATDNICSTGVVQTYSALTATSRALTTLTAGTYWACVVATDSAGNATTATPRTFTIDTAAPTISSVSLTSPSGTGTSVVGVNMDFTVTPSEAVTVSGTPTLPITIAGVSAGKVATYVSGSGTSALVFRYTTAANDNGILGWTTPITGTITDLASNSRVNPVVTAGTTSRTIDAVARIVIGTPSPLGPVSTTNIAWPVTYYGIPTGYLTAARVQINKTGTANASTPVTIGGSGTNFTVTLSGITGTGNLGISILNGTLVDPYIPPVITLATTSYWLEPSQAMTNITPTLTGGVLTGCATSPALPAGLSINPTNCVISGTPSTTQSQTAYTITATNAGGTGTKTVYIGVNATLSANAGTGGGSVSPTSGSYNYGATAYVYAYPSGGYNFSYWSGSCAGQGSTCSLSMTANRSSTAYFALQTFTLNAYAGGGGSVSPTSGTYNYGTSVSVTAYPSTGYYFSSWGGDCAGQGQSCSLSMYSSKSTTAYFGAYATCATYRCTGSCGFPVQGACTGNQPVAHGNGIWKVTHPCGYFYASNPAEADNNGLGKQWVTCSNGTFY